MAQTIHPALAPTATTATGVNATAIRAAAGALLFIIGAGFMTMIMLAASVAPAYDYHGAAISDLGVIAETSGLFNATLVTVGAVMAVGGYLFYRSHRSRWLLATFAVAGLGAAGAGLVPLDRSDLHGLFALLAFALFNVAAIGSGLTVHGTMRWISILSGVVGLAFVILMAIGDAGNAAVFGPMGHGGAERMIVYPVMLWLMAFGGYLTAPVSDIHDRRSAVLAGETSSPASRGPSAP